LCGIGGASGSNGRTMMAVLQSVGYPRRCGRFVTEKKSKSPDVYLVNGCGRVIPRSEPLGDLAFT
jgi:hypothetical protein